jgi:hypothetical protein
MTSFLLPELDTDFLKEKGYSYELLSHGAALHLILKGFQLPAQHYIPEKVDLLIEIPPAYPNAPLDMFWTNPEVKLLNGGVPKTTESRADYHGRTWQRWSRHYVTPWRPNVDGIKNFIRSIVTELQKGI